MPDTELAESRRRFLAYFSSAGLTSTLLPGVLWEKLQAQSAAGPVGAAGKLTAAMVRDALTVAGVEFNDDETQAIVAGANQSLERYRRTAKLRHRPDGATVGVFQSARPRHPLRPRAETVSHEQGDSPAPPRPSRRPRLSSGPAPGAPAEDASGQVGRAHRDVPGAVGEVRPGPQLRRHADHRAGAGAGDAGRSGDRCGALPRPAPRHPVGMQGHHLGAGISHHVGRARVEDSR